MQHKFFILKKTWTILHFLVFEANFQKRGTVILARSCSMIVQHHFALQLNKQTMLPSCLKQAIENYLLICIWKIDLWIMPHSTSHCVSKIVPSIEERKEEKRKKNDPKVEEDSIWRQIFRGRRQCGGGVASLQAQVVLACVLRAAFMHFPAIFHSN